MTRGLFVAIVAGCTACSPSRDWPVTGGDPGNTRFSPLDQINRGNVAQLRVAWTYHTGDAPPQGPSEIQATPIVVGGVLYTTTPSLAVIALRADRGTLLWRFQTGGNPGGNGMEGSPMSYSVDGKQFIAIAAGDVLYSFALPD